jgi:hypothetical protein
MNFKSRGSLDASIFCLGESSFAFFVVRNWFRFVLGFCFFFQALFDNRFAVVLFSVCTVQPITFDQF